MIFLPHHMWAENNNFSEELTDLLLYEKNYRLITKLHTLIKKDSHMKPGFRSEVLYGQNERCIKQKSTNIDSAIKIT